MFSRLSTCRPSTPWEGRMVNRSTSSWPSMRPAPDASSSLVMGGVVVEPEAEVCPRELLVVEGRIAAQVGEDALHEGQDQLFVLLDDLPEERFVSGRGPVVRLAVVRVFAQVESPAAEDPALDEIGMHPAGLLDGKVPLVDRTVALRLVLHLVGHRRVREELGHLAFGLLVQAGRDFVILEDHETDALHGFADVPGELRPALRTTVEEEAHVAGPDLRFLVEFLLRPAFGQVVGLFLFHLVVLCVFLVYRLDAMFLFGLIGAHDRTPGPAGRCS